MTREKQIADALTDCSKLNLQIGDAIDVAGQTTVDDVIRFTCQGYKEDELTKVVSGGVDLEFATAVAVIAALVVTVKNLFDIYDHCEKRLQRKATKTDLQPLVTPEVMQSALKVRLPLTADELLSVTLRAYGVERTSRDT